MTSHHRNLTDSEFDVLLTYNNKHKLQSWNGQTFTV